MIQIVENQILTCPMAGWADSVKHSPDTYIAAGLLGAGVVLFPHEGVLRAPCCGVVTFLRPEKYALGIQGQQGMEILFQVGVDTAALQEAITQVQPGSRVVQGQELLRFDLKAMERKCASSSVAMVLNVPQSQIQCLKIGETLAGEPLLNVTV